MPEHFMYLGIVALVISAVHFLVSTLLNPRVSGKRPREIRYKLEHVIDRTHSWWAILIVLTLAFYFQKTGICILFSLVSFYALREFVTLASSSSSDHRAMFWMFFIVIPLQYISIYHDWQLNFNYLVPFFALIFLPVRSAMGGDTKRFLERTATLQWGLMTSVFCVSHLPAILLLDIPGFTRNSELLLYFVLITQINDVIQHETSLWIGKYKIAPQISSLRTWEGWFLGSILCTLLGGLLAFMTPFYLGQALVISFICTQLGFAGSIVMSAIKRSRGIQDFDEMIPGHGGVLDRIDSIIFSAPVFLHIVRNL